MIAESIIAAASELGPLQLPMVVRLQGTNSEAGLKLVSLARLHLDMIADEVTSWRMPILEYTSKQISEKRRRRPLSLLKRPKLRHLDIFQKSSLRNRCMGLRS
jgi:hypothetical protein